MNMFKAFEERIAKAFGESSLGVVAPFSFRKLARQAMRELEHETYVVDGVNTAPALMTVLISPDDDVVMRSLYAQLADEITDLMEAEAAQKDYVFVGKPLARFMVDSSLRHGRFAVFANNVDALTLEKLRDEERAFLAGFGAFSDEEVIVPIEEPVVSQPLDDIPVVEHAISDDPSAGLDVLPANYIDEPYDLVSLATPAAGADELPVPEPLPDMPEPVTPAKAENPVGLAQSVPALDPVDLSAVPSPENEPEQDEPETPSDTPAAATADPTANASADDAVTVAADALPVFDDDEEPVTCLLIDRQSGRTFMGTAPETIIGRERTPAGIVLRDPNVSRRHAKLVFENGAWRIIDLNSTNGTLVNEIDVDTCVLRDGDVLTLGLTNLEFRES